MITMDKIKQRYDGYICRRCINKIYHVNLTRHDCIYKSYGICPCCGEEHNIVHGFRTSGQKIMRKARQGNRGGFKKRYAILALLAVLAIVVATVVGTHWDIIQMAKLGLTTDPSTIQQNQEEKDKEIEENLGVSGLITDDMVTTAEAEIEDYVNTGELNLEFVISPALTPSQSSGGLGSSTNTGSLNAGSENIGGSDNQTDIVAAYTARLYGIRNVFQGKLDVLISEAKAEYSSLPSEKQNRSSKTSILYSKLDQAEKLESQCDAMVDTYLRQMETDLKATGQSTDSVKQLRDYYQEAKINQKAAYLAMARGGL